MQGYEAVYEPISIVEFRGNINPFGQSEGHYVCDVKEETSKLWFRTNDNCYPIPIRLDQVSKNAYIVLLKRSDE